MRATVRPGKSWSNSTASSVPSPTVMTSTEPSSTSVLRRDAQKSGSVTRNS